MRKFRQRQHLLAYYVNYRLITVAAVALLLLQFVVGHAHGAQAKLTWDPPKNADGTRFKDFVGYRVYVGSASSTYNPNPFNVGKDTTSYTLDNLTDGATYYFAVTDYDGAGNESDYSNEVTVTFPALPPGMATPTLHSVTATAGAGGTIRPVGAEPASSNIDRATTITRTMVSEGADQSFDITPNSGYAIADVTVDGISVGPVSYYTFSKVAIDHTLTATFVVRINVALQANGGQATASSTYSHQVTFPATAINNGDRKGLNWGNTEGGGWNDDTINDYTNDWARITFPGLKSITEIDVFTLQDNYSSPQDPTGTQTFTLYGITDFDVQQWNGAEWVTVPNGAITGNRLVWRKITFPAITTDRIRVVVKGALEGYSRITEIEAYEALNDSTLYSLTATAGVGGMITPRGAVTVSTTTDNKSTTTVAAVTEGAAQSFDITPDHGNAIADVTIDGISVGAVSDYTFSKVSTDHTLTATFVVRTNVALQANGGQATASSIYNATHPVTALNNGDRKGLNWGNGGGWNDGTYNDYTDDWAQITFAGSKTITEIDVFTLRDIYDAPQEPTETQTFSLYGITDFDVQQWDGAEWVTVPGGAVTGNDLVWRKITFPAITTDRIRVLVKGALEGYSRITEIEAY